MKIRFLVTAALAFSMGHAPAVFGVTGGQSGMLANYDARESMPVKAALSPKPGQRAAEAALKQLVPGLEVSRNTLIGTPRFISARNGFLTGPQGTGRALSEKSLLAVSPSDPHRALKAFINEHAPVFGHDASVLNSAAITRDGIGEHNGLRTTVWQQTHQGIPVFDALLVSHITGKGELVSVADQFLPDVVRATEGSAAKLAAGAAPISAARALVLAAKSAGVELTEGQITVTRGPEGPEQYQVLESPEMAVPAYNKLVWLPMGPDSARLCWRVVANVRPVERYLMVIDSESGEILVRRSLTIRFKDISFNVYTNDSPSPFSPGHLVVSNQQPVRVPPVVVKTSALDTNASPFGWINDTDTTISGNNAAAFLDRDLNFAADGPLLNGGVDRNFEYDANLDNNPGSYGNAAVAQLFWRANWYHDRMYQLGFTEDSGNYQRTNFNRGGLGRDALVCLAQAGSEAGYSDNAFFMPAPDGEPGYVAMFTWSGPSPQRDGSLDSEIVIHELTHGLSDRLLGAGVGIFRLQPSGMGEGWSDFYALALLSEPTDEVHANYATGGYVTYEMVPGFRDNYYFGVRRYPYTTDMSKNPFTLKDIDPTQASVHAGVPVSPIFGGTDADEVHAMGEVWCAALWEVRAAIIDKVGWQEGNELALQLVTDGLKLAPENATFLEARDAIVQADQIYTGGAMYNEIWVAFAKRGYGYSAQVPNADTTRGVSEAFDLPPDVTIGPPDGILEVKFNPAPGSLIFAGEDTPVFVKVTDSVNITNATIDARIVGGAALTFVNNGNAPDSFANDSTYSSSFVAPTNATSITLAVVVSAPGVLTSTNEITYFIIRPPANDAFALAIKVPASGTNYFTSNKKATLEEGEPKHAGVQTVAASLWWNYVPSADGEILVDTGGTEFTTVVAVYTNSVLTNLQAVATAVGSTTVSGRQGAFLRFNGRAGVTYRMAVSSRDSRSTGTLRLRIGTGAQPDTNSPVVLVTSPPSGYVTTTNRVQLGGSAVDAEPNPSGIKLLSVNIATLPGFDDSEITIYPRLSFDGPSSTNWNMTIGLRPGRNKISVTALDYAGNRSPASVVEVLYRVVDPNNDFFAGAQVLSVTSSVETVSVNTLVATKEVGEPNHAGNVGGKSAWWYFDAPTDGVLDLSTTNSSFDTVLAVYTGTKVNELTPRLSNDDAFEGSGFSALSQPVKGGTRYYIAVDGYDAAAGVVFLSHSFSAGTVFAVTLNAGMGGQVPASSLNVHSNGVVTIDATPDDGYIFDMWDGSIVALSNPISIQVRSNMTLNARFVAKPFSDGFESGNLSGLGWTAGGNAPWTVQNAVSALGGFSAKSGNIGHGQTSSLVLTGNFRAGTGSFAYRVDSEPVWDRLNFFMDGMLLQAWSGNAPWANYAFPIQAGVHTLEWRYTKDQVNTVGADAAYIDNVLVPLAVAVNSSTPARLSMQQQFDGNYYINLLGQPGQLYVVQYSTNLVNWSGISTNIALDGTLKVLDPQSKAGNARYYRALTPQ